MANSNSNSNYLINLTNVQIARWLRTLICNPLKHHSVTNSNTTFNVFSVLESIAISCVQNQQQLIKYKSSSSSSASLSFLDMREYKDDASKHTLEEARVMCKNKLLNSNDVLDLLQQPTYSVREAVL